MEHPRSWITVQIQFEREVKLWVDFIITGDGQCLALNQNEVFLNQPIREGLYCAVFYQSMMNEMCLNWRLHGFNITKVAMFHKKRERYIHIQMHVCNCSISYKRSSDSKYIQ